MTPKMVAVLAFVGGLLAMAYQVYQLNEFRVQTLFISRQQLYSPPLEQNENAEKPGLAPVIKLHLMGVPQAPQANQENKPIVDTNLKLELVGTIRGDFSGRDSAIIQAKGKEAKRYYVGEQVEGGAILDAVEEEAVMLRRGGAVEALRYSKTALDAAPANNVAPVRPTPATRPPAQQARKVPPAQAPAAPGADQQTTTTLRERLRKKGQPAQQPQNAQ